MRGDLLHRIRSGDTLARRGRTLRILGPVNQRGEVIDRSRLWTRDPVMVEHPTGRREIVSVGDLKRDGWLRVDTP